MDKIIFATKNKGKMDEIRDIMKDMDINLLSMEEAGINLDVVEDGDTFEANAVKKAEEIRDLTQCIVLADDSGLEVDYLNKAPGVYSARYLGSDTPYEIKNKKIISLLEGVPAEKRTARFVSVIAAAFPDRETIVTRGTIEGIIDYEIKGINGFGYDPIFYVPAYGITTAEMDPALKNKISHRGQALSLMKECLATVLKSVNVEGETN